MHVHVDQLRVVCVDGEARQRVACFVLKMILARRPRDRLRAKLIL